MEPELGGKGYHALANGGREGERRGVGDLSALATGRSAEPNAIRKQRKRERGDQDSTLTN